MLDKGTCPSKSAAAPICVAQFHAASEDSVGAIALIKIADGMPMAVMVPFQKRSASASVLACHWFFVECAPVWESSPKTVVARSV